VAARVCGRFCNQNDTTKGAAAGRVIPQMPKTVAVPAGVIDGATESTTELPTLERSACLGASLILPFSAHECPCDAIFFPIHALAVTMSSGFTTRWPTNGTAHATRCGRALKSLCPVCLHTR
jgi:hypothetical protein